MQTHLENMEHLSLLSVILFGDSPEKLSEKKQKKYCQWIRKHCEEEVAQIPDRDEDEKLIAYICKICRIGEQEQQRKKEELRQRLDSLGEEAKGALLDLSEQGGFESIDLKDGIARIFLDDLGSYRRTLILEDAAGIPDGKYEEGEELSLSAEDGFKLLFEIKGCPSALSFSKAQVLVEPMNACKIGGYFSDPWDFLNDICRCIREKSNLPGNYCNQKELALLPLIRELAEMEPGEQLLALLEKHRCKEGVAQVQKIMEMGADYKRFNRLMTLLCRAKWSPIWREVFMLLQESQQEYPAAVERLEPTLLQEKRAEIERLMAEAGFQGSYPEFYKIGPMKGLHLEHSYEENYIIGMKKRVIYRVRCEESLQWGQLRIHLLGGQDLKGQTTDFYDCLFAAKGQRNFLAVHHLAEVDEPISLAVRTLIKRIQCQKLSKEERICYNGDPSFDWGDFFGFLLIGGGLFTLVMMFFTVLLCGLVALLFWAPLKELLGIMPWGLLIGICWVGFGLSMGWIEATSNRR